MLCCAVPAPAPPHSSTWQGQPAKQAAPPTSGVGSMPVLTTSAPMSDSTAEIWARMKSVGATCTASTPWVFCRRRRSGGRGRRGAGRGRRQGGRQGGRVRGWEEPPAGAEAGQALCWAGSPDSYSSSHCSPVTGHDSPGANKGPRSPTWAVRAVTAVALYAPAAMIALTSAWMPAPPPLSLPAMLSTRGTCGGGQGGRGEGGRGRRGRAGGRVSRATGRARAGRVVATAAGNPTRHLLPRCARLRNTGVWAITPPSVGRQPAAVREPAAPTQLQRVSSRGGRGSCQGAQAAAAVTISARLWG